MGADTSAYKTDDGGNILHFAVECASHFKGTWEATKDTSQCLKELLKKTKLMIDQPDNNGMLSKIITSLLLATNQNQRSISLLLFFFQLSFLLTNPLCHSILAHGYIPNS